MEVFILIKVTEEQAKVIEHHLYNFADKKVHCLGLIERDTNLGIVVIARIVEGEQYEVEYEFKVGDIVLYEKYLYEYIKEENGRIILSDGICQTNKTKKEMILVCKAENREDKKGE